MEIESSTQTSTTTQAQIQYANSLYLSSYSTYMQKDIDTIDLNFNDINTLSNNEIKEIFRDNKQEQIRALRLKQLSQISTDKNFNKVIFEKAQTMNDMDILTLSHTLNTTNSIDYYSDNILSYNNLKNIAEHKEITSIEKLRFRSSESSVSFLEKTLDYIDTSVKYNSFMEHPNESKKAQEFHEIFNDIKKDYINSVNEDTGVLSSYINYSKPLSLEEKQQHKDQEQFDLAMRGHGLNPTSDFDIFKFKFMQKGYSVAEAEERTNIYSSAGLIPHNDWFEKFGVRVYDLSMIASFPTLRESMMETYDKMDTEQLREVASRMSSGFSMNIEQLEEILGEESTSNPREVMARVKKYWNNLYGTEEKMMNMFNEKLKEIDQDQRFSVENLMYIKEGINMLIENYKEKIDKNTK